MTKVNKKRVKKHINIGDKIKIITGSQKGLLGSVLSLNVKKKQVIIDGVPSREKHLKSINKEDKKKIDLPQKIHFSNVVLWDKKLVIDSNI